MAPDKFYTLQDDEISEDNILEDRIDVGIDLDSDRTILSDILDADDDIDLSQMSGVDAGQGDEVEIIWVLPVSNLPANFIIDHHILPRHIFKSIHLRRYVI
jgi:hypothetical protein